MERFFATFAAGNAQKLNEVISKYAEDNSYIEVSRSQPSMCYDEHYHDTSIAVTSTFRNMTEYDAPDGSKDYYSDIAEPRENL